MVKKFVLFFMLSCLFFGCKSKPVVKKDESKITFQEKGITKEIYNEDKTLLLILTYKDDFNIPKTFNYKVIDSKKNETKKEGVFIGSRIVWYDKNSLQCFEHQGIVEKEEDSPQGFTIIKIK